MKNLLVLIFFSSFFLLSCNKEKSKTNTFNLSYARNIKDIILNFKNNTNTDIIFLAPNAIEFESLNNKDYQNVYGVIEPNQSDKYYQKILDSLYIKTLIDEKMQVLIDLKRPSDGHSVFYLKKNSYLKVLYKLKI